MKTISFLFFAFLFAAQTKAQEWKTYFDDKGVTIQYRTTEYTDASSGIQHERIIFRYENKTNQEVQLNFNRLITYSGSKSPKAQEKTFSLIIPANSISEYNSTNSSDKTFYLFAKDKNNKISSSLISFDIQNIIIR